MEHADLTEMTGLQRLYARRVQSKGTIGADCVTPEAILAVVLREGAEADRLATLEHIMKCAACHREYEWLKAVDQAGLEAEGRADARRRPTWWRSTPLALAASIAAIGAAVVFSGVLRPGFDRERGTAGDLSLIAPEERASSAGPITFTWHRLPEASRYVLEIQRTDGSVALADTTADTVAVIEPGQLQGGSVYRWWVREVTDGAEPRSSAFRGLKLGGP